ncbi:Septin-9 [Acropora cervicornis]|uniref:Septin-9 n=1 Tax=Acropora cervicornis TaxID=6130 RepID=A0AAD9R2T7_ACRCE|nr:Septin-9 [Acropora cervicornis]
MCFQNFDRLQAREFSNTCYKFYKLPSVAYKIFKEDCVTNTGSPGNELSLNRNQQVLRRQLTKMASSDKVGLIRLKFLGSQSFDRQLFSVFQQFILTGAQVEGLLSYQNFIEIMKETMQAMTHWGKLKTVLEGYVGFDTVQEQIRKKSLKRGFEFNLMVVGQ